MSLIQDALKRQQEESENSREPMKEAPGRPQSLRDNVAGGAEPAVPEDMPVAQAPEPKASLVMALRHGLKMSPSMPSEPEPEAPPASDQPDQQDQQDQPDKSGKSRLLIAIIIIFCLLIVLGGIWVIPQAKQLLGRYNLLSSRAPVVNRTVQAPPPAAMPQVAAKPKPVAATANAPAPWISSAAAAAPAFADEGEDVEVVVAVPGMKEQELPMTVSSPVPVAWPRLKLSAIFSNMGSGQSGARLNNRLILLGDQIDGVTLVEIHPSGVVLKCGKETRTLKMGATLN